MPQLKITLFEEDSNHRDKISDILDEIENVNLVYSSIKWDVFNKNLEKLSSDILLINIDLAERGEIFKKILNLENNPIIIYFHEDSKIGSQLSNSAVELGAFGCVSKPKDMIHADSLRSFKKRIELMLERVKTSKNYINNLEKHPKDQEEEDLIVEAKKSTIRSESKYKIVVIGISTGGPRALQKMIPKIPADLGVPIVIVQHMPAEFTASLANSLNERSELNVVECDEGMIIEPGNVYIAKGGFQNKLIEVSNKVKIRLKDDPPENYCKPSVDYMFRTVAAIFKNEALGIIMTGMGSDGLQGIYTMVKSGADIIAQDKDSSTVFGMNKEVIKAGLADEIIPLEKLASRIVSLVKYKKG